jgi:hypothetical protein
MLVRDRRTNTARDLTHLDRHMPRFVVLAEGAFGPFSA